MRFLRPPRFGRLLAYVAVIAAGFAQAQTFSQPQVVPTPSFAPPWPTSLAGGALQVPGRTDLVVIYRGVADPSPGYPLNSDVGTAQYLNNGTGTLTYANQNSPEFTATSVVATIADFNGDGKQDVAFATSNAMKGFEDLCVDFGKGGGAVDYTQSGCASLALVKTVQPQLTYIAAISLKTGSLPQLILEDSANGYTYLLQNSGASNPTPGALPSFTVKSRYALPAADGAGPIFVADLNGDGNQDFIVNGQSGRSASVYLGNGDGTFRAPIRYVFTRNVHSMLLHDMDGDGQLDMLVEGDSGIIEIHRGEPDGSFDSSSMGGTSAGVDGTTGNGGHLIGVADLNHDGYLDILTATPAGVSVLLGAGAMTYQTARIYNAGPGHSSYVLADFNGDDNLDLAVDSPEGVAILYGNADGSFQTSRAFAAGQPAMSGALAAFTSSGNLDAVVSTAARQAQFLHGNGDGTFTYTGSPGNAIPTSSQSGPPGLWSVVQAMDLDSNGKTDIVLTADGPPALLPLSPQGLAVQNGDGSGGFEPPRSPTIPQQIPCPSSPGYLYGTSSPYVGSGGRSIFDRDYFGYWGVTYGSNAFGELGDNYSNSGKSCGPFAHNLILASHFQPSNLDSASLLVQGDGHLFLYGFNFFSPKLGDLSIDGSLTTPGQLVAPDISPIFPGPSKALGFNAFPGAAVAADLDGDGNTDLLVSYANLSADPTAPSASAPNYLYLWFGDGTGHYTVSAKHPVNPIRLTLSRNYYQVAVADLNGDGIPDLILSDGYIVSVQLGKGDGTFGAETHYLAGAGINTISVGDVNSDGKPDLVLANGGAVLTNPVANLETLGTNPDVNTGGITVLLNQATTPKLATPNGTVTASPEPGTYSSGFSLSATFPPSPANNVVSPTGTVTFTIDTTAVGSASITGMTASIAVPQNVYATLAPGVHRVTGTYSGDGNYAPTKLNGTHTVSLIPTSVELILCVDPPGSNFPCGNPLAATPLITPITLYYGQVLDGVAAESGTDLTGTIDFYAGSYLFCSLNASLQGGNNTCPPKLGYQNVGTTSDYAVYSGDSTHQSSTSNAITVTVLADATTAMVTSSLNPSTFGQNVTFTASVQGNYAPATGSVVFLDGTNPLATVTLDAAGHATLSTSMLAIGTHPITVAYAGNINFNPITSAILHQVVDAVSVPNPPPTGPSGFTLTVSPVPVTLGVGRTAVLLVNVVETGGFDEPVQLACTGLPVESTCTFVQQLVPAGGGSTTLYLMVTAPHACGTDTPLFLGSFRRPATGILLALLVFLPGLRRRRLPRTLLLLVSLCALATVSGCGNCTDLGTRPGDYSFTVIGAAQGATAGTQSQKIGLAVTIP